MGVVYKNKQGGGCRMCKPHKHGWTHKRKYKEEQLIKAAKKRVQEVLAERE